MAGIAPPDLRAHLLSSSPSDILRLTRPLWTWPAAWRCRRVTPAGWVKTAEKATTHTGKPPYWLRTLLALGSLLLVASAAHANWNVVQVGGASHGAGCCTTRIVRPMHLRRPSGATQRRWHRSQHEPKRGCYDTAVMESVFGHPQRRMRRSPRL